jgi:hypothetical protein
MGVAHYTGPFDTVFTAKTRVRLYHASQKTFFSSSEGTEIFLSSPALTLESWVRIPLEAWMSVCIYSVSVLSRMQVEALRRADPQSKECYRQFKTSRN